MGSLALRSARPRVLAASALVAATASVVLFLAAATPASAAPDPSCSPAALTDGYPAPGPYSWDLRSQNLNPGWNEDAGGFILDGTSDAYDGFGVLRVDSDAADTGGEGNPNSTLYLPPDGQVCTTEGGGREIVFPEMTVGTLKVSRKVFVPSSGVAFARFLDIIQNTGVTDVTRTVSYEGRVGSFSDTRITATSPVANRWIVSANCDSSEGPSCTFTDPTPGPPLAHVWDGPGSVAKPATGVYAGGTSSELNPWATSIGESRVRVVYQNVLIKAAGQDGDRVVFMHFEAQRPTNGDALAAARTLGNVTSPDGFAGLDETLEVANLVNWNEDDLDGDGKSNAEEAALGTNPRNSDTDADGVGDATDACPTTSGAGSNGCPVASGGEGGGGGGGGSTPPPSGSTPDTTAPRVTVIVQTKVKLKRFKRGLTAAARVNEPTSMKFELLGAPPAKKRARTRAKAFTRVLARQSLAMAGAGLRAARLRPAKKLLGKARKFVVQLRVTATDRAGNRTVVTRRIKVR